MDELIGVFVGLCAVILCATIAVGSYNSHTEKMYKSGACRTYVSSAGFTWIPCDKMKVDQ